MIGDSSFDRLGVVRAVAAVGGRDGVLLFVVVFAVGADGDVVVDVDDDEEKWVGGMRDMVDIGSGNNGGLLLLLLLPLVVLAG